MKSKTEHQKLMEESQQIFRDIVVLSVNIRKTSEAENFYFSNEFLFESLLKIYFSLKSEETEEDD